MQQLEWLWHQVAWYRSEGRTERAAQFRREANIIWRELKLRLVPTDSSGNPSR